MLRAEFRLPNGSCGIVIGDFHAFETVFMALREAGIPWNEEEAMLELSYPDGLRPKGDIWAEAWQRVRKPKPQTRTRTSKPRTQKRKSSVRSSK